MTLDDCKDYLRITGSDEDCLITQMISVAASDIEAQAELALMSQTITATTTTAPDQTVALPVGPVAQGASVTVASVAVDGTVTPIVAPLCHGPHWNAGTRLRLERLTRCPPAPQSTACFLTVLPRAWVRR